MQIIIGLTLGAAIGYLAFRAGALSLSGAFAAAATGGLIYGLGGLRWAVLLLAFFVSSSLLSRLFIRRKSAVEEKFSKGSRRDALQVLANGGLGALMVAIHSLQPTEPTWWLAFAGALAAVNADTWATELGVLSRSAPRLLSTGKVVERGASGGVTWLGYLAAAGGSGLIALLAALLVPDQMAEDSRFILGLLVWFSGLVGATVDSWLGAVLQAIYYCPACQKETERHPYHSCGTPTTPLRGLPWMNNGMVNGLASLAGAFSALMLGWLS